MAAETWRAGRSLMAHPVLQIHRPKMSAGYSPRVSLGQAVVSLFPKCSFTPPTDARQQMISLQLENKYMQEHFRSHQNDSIPDLFSTDKTSVCHRFSVHNFCVALSNKEYV